MKTSTKTNLFLDLTIFAAFLVASNPSLSGLAVHEWLGISFAAVLVTHLLFHWDWVVNQSKTFFKKLFHASGLNYVVDSLLFVAMTAAMLSGILISQNVLPTFGIQLEASRSWRSIHSLSANLSLVLVALHFALHWKWVVTNVQRYILAPLTKLVNHPVSQTTTQLTGQPVKIEEHE